MSGRLLQITGAVVDLLYKVDSVPQAGEEANVTGFSTAPGGGFNAMVAARREGMAVAYGGALGTGPFAEVVRRGLQVEGITMLLARDPDRDQGCCTVLIDKAGERTFVAGVGAEGHASRDALLGIDAGEYDWMLLSGYTLHYPGARDAITGWLAHGSSRAPLVFDPSPVVAELDQTALRTALDCAAWISANRSEAGVLTGHADPAEAARALAKGRSGGAIVRTGADGCVIATAGEPTRIPGLPVRAIDTNGAGDTHIGSFIAALHRTADPIAAAHYANAAAAISTTVKGPATAPRPEAVVELLNAKNPDQSKAWT